MAKNIDNLNFKVILDDKDFDTRVKADIQLAKDLNIELSKLLQAKVNVNKISAQEAASAKRASDILAKQAIDQERITQAKAKTAEAEEKTATQAAKTTKELERANVATSQTVLNAQRLATETNRTAAAASQRVVNEQRIRTETQRTATEVQRTATATQNAANATARAQLAQRRLADYAGQTTREYQAQSRLVNELKGYALGYLSIHGASQLLSSLVRVTGEFELQKTTLAAMLGDLNVAEQVITRIQGLAVESPFQFKELTTYAKQLSAFSVPAQELYDTTKMLADISAGLGVGMDRIVLAYGQVRSAAFLRGQEVRQFTEAGIPILDELAKQFSELEGRVVSTTEVFDKISSRLVPFEMVAKVFKDMTSEGGKFYNMQEVQAETLRGKISNLKDAYEVMLNEIGKGQSENLKGAVDWARRLMQNYEDTGKALVELVAAYGVYKATLLALTVVTNNFALANSRLYTTIISATKWAINNPYAVLAAGITAAGYAIYKNITALEGYEKVHKSFVDTEKKYNDALASEELKLDALYAKLKLAKEGTEEYEKAKRQIYTQYAGYISELKEEGVEVGNLVTLYDSLKIKVQEYTQAKFRSLAQTDLDQTFEQEVSNVRDRYKTLVSQINTLRDNAGEEALSAMDKEGLWQYITGDIATMWDMAENPELNRIKNVLRSKILPFGDIADELKGDMAKIKSTYAEDMQAIINLYGETEEELEENNPFKIPLEGEGSGKSPAQKAIEEQIKSIEKLKDAYEKLLPYLDELQMKSTLKQLFPNIGEAVIDSLDFNAELERLADRLEEFDEDAAQRLRDSISKDVAGAMADSFRAVEQYKKMLDSWLGEDFDLVGEGTAFDISKILNNLNNEYAKIDQKRQRALDLLNKAQLGDEIALAKVREVYGEEVWQKYLEKGEEVINELATKERGAARKTANEKIRDLADKDLKERMQKANINLTEFDDKTIKQVEDAYNRLFVLRNQLRNELDDLKANGVTEEEVANVQRLEEEVVQASALIEETGVELDKKLYDRARSAMDAISGLGSSISELGEAMKNAKIAEFGQDMSKAASLASDLIDAFESKDTIAIIANVANAVISQITGIVTAAYEEQNRLNEAAREYAEIMLNIRRDAYSGVFGTDEMGLAAENQKILAEAQKEYNKALEKFQSEKQWRREDYFDRITTKNISVSDVINNIADSQGWELYRANGELNIEMLKSYYDAYAEHLTNTQKEVVDALIESYDAQNNAAKASAEYMTSLFSSAADSIAESMVNAFIESGNAATDLRGIVSDVASMMATDLIKSLYVLPILNDYAKELEAISNNNQLTADQKTAQALALLQTGVETIKDNEDAINSTLAELEPYFTKENEGSNALGEGIKGITEDQANLLASYLNAIRADVSYSKTLWIRMDSNLQRIAEMFTSSPSLMEYQAQIAANTYNTAIATQDILSELRSVVTTETGASSIRVYKDN